MASQSENSRSSPVGEGQNAWLSSSLEPTIAKALLEALPNFAFIVDREQRYLYVSENVPRLLNQQRENLIGKSLQELGMPKEQASQREAKRRRVFETGQPQTDIQETPSLPGNPVFEYLYTPLCNAEGEVEAVLCIAKDITEQRRAEEALRRSETRYRALAEAVSKLIWVRDAIGRAKDTSAAWLHFTGQTQAEYEGWGWLDVVHPDDQEQIKQAWQQAVATQSQYEARYRLRRQDGVYRNMVARAFPVRDEQGEIIEWIGASNDITDALQAEQARQKAEAQHSATESTMYAILDNAPAIISFKDLEGRYLFLNRQHEKVHKRTREEAIGKTNFELFSLAHAESAQKQDRYVIETGEVWSNESRVEQDDGIHTYLAFRFPLRDAEGKIYATCGIATDITDQKHLEAQLYQAQKMEGIGRLAGGIAHDFNNLLTAIMGYTELAEMEAEPESEVSRHLQTVQQAAQSAASLTRQLLAFARKQVMETQVFSLNTLIVETDKMLRRVIGEDIELVTLTYPDLRFVKADPNQMTQVLVNLAVNARDAMPTGGKLTLETDNVYLDENYARSHAEVQPGPYVLMAVADTGTGMTDEVKAHLFEPFFTTKEVGKGTGLGLATCYGIIKQNGGHIWVYSELGQGTTFKVYLPCVEEPITVSHSPEYSTAMPTGTETILMTEDEPMLRTLAVEILKAQGYRVLVATNGSDALRVAAETWEAIHLLLTDVVMPHMGGRELSRRLQALRPGLKTLYVSGYTENSIVHHGTLEAGIHFLQKPYMPAVLVRKVREVLDAVAL